MTSQQQAARRRQRGLKAAETRQAKLAALMHEQFTSGYEQARKELAQRSQPSQQDLTPYKELLRTKCDMISALGQTLLEINRMLSWNPFYFAEQERKQAAGQTGDRSSSLYPNWEDLK